MNDLTNTETAFGQGNIFKLIIKYGVPCAISLVVNSLYNIVDQIFIGQSVGYLGNAATNVSFGLVVLSSAFAIFIGDGSAAFYSLTLGAQNKKKAATIVGNCISLLLFFSIFFVILGYRVMMPFLNIFGATAEVMPYAVDYTRIILIGFPAAIINIGINSLMRADGSPNYAMATMLAGALINIILDPIFIFRYGMGVKGAAIATILGQYVSLIMSLAYLKFFKNIKFEAKNLIPQKFVVFKLCALGTSSFLTQISFVIVVSVVNQLLVRYGSVSIYGSEIPLASFGIVMKVNQILTSVLLGIALGSQPIAGYNYGAKQYARVKQTFKLSVLISTCCAFFAFIAFMFFPKQIISIFGQESPLYVEFAVKCFRLHLPFCILNGFYITSTILFQAIGQPIKSTLLSIARQILFIVPLSMLMGMLYGIDGVLIGGALADLIAFILSFIMVFLEIKELNKLKTQQATALKELQ